jgi:hypothetical protein
MNLRRYFWLAIALASVMPAVAQISVTNGTLKITNGPTAPFPAVIAAAKAAGIPWEGMDKPARANSLLPGDSVTALLTLHQKKQHPLQWLVYLQVAGETDSDSSQGEKPMILYTANGNRFEFRWSPASLRARTLGPFANPDSHSKSTEHQDRSAGIAVNEGFLSLGLEKGAESVCRWNELSREKNMTNFDFNIADKPFDEAKIERNRNYAARFGITAEEERSVVAWVPALLSYFGTVQQTPNLQDLLAKVVAMPSAWWMAKTLVTHHGITAMAAPDLGNVATVLLPKSWGLLSDLPVHSVPWTVSINNKPVVNIQMLVTEPSPPLLACGGIIDMMVSNPDDRENYFTVRVISARYQPADKAGTALAKSQIAAADDSGEADMRAPWERIAMIGASLTAGFTMSEPFGGPKTEQCRLSRYVDAGIKVRHEPVQNFATPTFFMAPVVNGREQIRQALNLKPTLVTAVDFLFWFCYGHGIAEQQRLPRLEKGLSLLDDFKCPLVIGDIPDVSAAVGTMLTADEVPAAATRDLANQRIRQWAADRANVVIIPIAQLMRAIASNDPVTFHGATEPRGATRRFLQDDQLHPTPAGCAFLAESIFDSLCSRQQSFAADDVLWDPKEILRRGFPGDKDSR